MPRSARFFIQPAGSGERVAVIPPMATRRAQAARLGAGAQLAPLVVEGRKLLVPLVAINALYRWSGGEVTEFVELPRRPRRCRGGKLAPFRLDLGARSWSGLAARPHSTGLQR